MRNGCTIEIRERAVLSYTSPPREFVMWTGWCEGCGTSISYLDIGGGRYAGKGRHEYDIVECIQVAQQGRRAA